MYEENGEIRGKRNYQQVKLKTVIIHLIVFFFLSKINKPSLHVYFVNTFVTVLLLIVVYMVCFTEKRQSKKNSIEEASNQTRTIEEKQLLVKEMNSYLKYFKNKIDTISALIQSVEEQLQRKNRFCYEECSVFLFFVFSDIAEF